jgi:flagellar basal body-associated protein FliL
MPEKKQNRKSTFIIIFVFVGILIVAIIGSVYAISTQDRDPRVSVRVPVIRTPLVSANDGREYTVQTQFYVHMDREMLKTVKQNDLEEMLTGIMKNMDYDEINCVTGVEYINNRATEELNRHLNTDETTRVVVTDMSTTDRIQLQDPANRVSETLKGMSDSFTN